MFLKNPWLKSAVLIIWFLTQSSFVFAADQVFQGNFAANDEYGNMSVDIRFNVAENTSVYLDFLSECTTQDKAYMEFYTPWGGRITKKYDGNRRPGVKATEIVLPYGPFPLTAGNYGVRLYCDGEEWDPGSAVGYRLTVSSSAGIVSQFSRDPEPNDSEGTPIRVTGNTSVEGWLGLGGYESLKGTWCDGSIGSLSDCGFDATDTFFFYITKGTTFKLKIEYDDAFTDNCSFRDKSKDMFANIVFVKGDHNYFVTTYDKWTYSGAVSHEVTALESGIYKIKLGGGIQGGITGEFYHGGEWPTMPLTNYGGYRLTVVVNDEPEPEGVYVTIQEATWIKTLLNGQTVQALKIDYEVESTYNVTKNIEKISIVQAPLARDVPGKTFFEERSKIIASWQQYQCPSDNINWDQFCTGRSLTTNNLCRLYLDGTVGVGGGERFSMPGHSKMNFTDIFPVSPNVYRSFDDSFQLVSVSLDDGSGKFNARCVHGLYFWPAWSIVPSLQPLLLGD